MQTRCLLDFKDGNGLDEIVVCGCDGDVKNVIHELELNIQSSIKVMKMTDNEKYL